MNIRLAFDPFNVVVVAISKYIFMVSLLFLYIPVFKYICGSIEVVKVSITLISNAVLHMDMDFTVLLHTLNTDTKYYLINLSNNWASNPTDYIISNNIKDIFLNELLSSYTFCIDLGIDINFVNSRYLHQVKEVFFTTSSSSDSILFYPLQRKIYCYENETSLVFFRIINLSTNSVNGISTYTVFPIDFLPYVRKLQCFCFDEILISPNEIIDLPVLFYLDFNNVDLSKITFCYTFLEIRN